MNNCCEVRSGSKMDKDELIWRPKTIVFQIFRFKGGITLENINAAWQLVWLTTYSGSHIQFGSMESTCVQNTTDLKTWQAIWELIYCHHPQETH